MEIVLDHRNEPALITRITRLEKAPYLTMIERPLLLMFAENDPLVSATWSRDALTSIYPPGMPEGVEFYVVSGEEHSFKMAPKCYRGNGWKG